MKIKGKLMVGFALCALLSVAPGLLHWWRSSETGMLLISVVSAAGCLIAGLVLARNDTRPLQHLAEAAKAVAGGDLGRRLSLDGQEEFGDLPRALNGMLDGLAANSVSWGELEAAVRQRTAELDQFFTASADGMGIGDFHGNPLRVNAAFAGLFGYTEAEFIAIPPQENIHPEDFPILEGALRQLITGQAGVVEYEVRGGCRDGSWKMLSCRAVAAPDLKLIFVTARDVTEWRHTAQALRESEENLATTLASIGDGVLATDVEARITRLNPVAEELTGWKSVEAIGRPVDEVFQVLHEDTRRKAVLPVAEVIANGRGARLADRALLLNRDGSERPIADSCAPIRNGDGKVIGTVLVFRDVTEERLAAEQLGEREIMLRTLSNNIPSGATFRLIRADDQSFYFQCIGESIEGLIGVSAAAIMADQHKLFDLIHEDDLALIQNAGETSRLNLSPFDCQTRIRTTLGQIKWLHWRSLPRPLPDGGIAWDGLIVDITPLKLAKAELQELNENLEAAVRQRTADLTESERRHRTLLSNLQGMAYRCLNDPDWTMEFMSEGSREILGVEPADFMTGRICYESVIHPDDRQHVRKEVQAALSKNRPFALEYRIKHLNGEWRWVWEQGRGVVDPVNETTALEGFITDISQRKLTEEVLLAQEARLTSLFRALPAGVGVSRNRVFTEVNERFCEMSGYTIDELLGQNTRLVYASDEEFASVGRSLYGKAHGGGIGSVESRWRRKNGEVFDVLISSCPLDPAEPSVIMFTVADITALKRAQEQVVTLSKAIEQSPVSVMITDLEGKIQYVNPRFTQVTGYEAREVMGRNPRLLSSGETSRDEYRHLWRTITSGGEWRGKFHNKKKDGRLYWEMAFISAIRDPRGAITHFLAIKEDITEKMRLEEQFLRSQRMQSLGTLASGVAHDLNNVLTPILLAIDLLRPAVQGTKKESMLNMLNDGVMRGAGIVRQLLTYGRGVEGQRVELRLNSLVKEMVKIMAETFPKSISLEQNVSNSLWSVHADATQIHQVLLNLCVNARDAMPCGGRLVISAENTILNELDARANLDAKAGPHIILSVGDTGSGIPPELLEKIFDPFFTTKEQGKGTGLGLSTVLGIVKSHKGFIQVSSRMEKGTQFKVYLPAIQGNVAEKAPVQFVAPPAGNGEFILVVDDEEAIREVASAMLEKNGYRVLTAENGAEGLVTYSKHREEIRAVITDMVMPVMDGATLMRVLRSYSPKLRIIAMSGLAEQEDVAFKAENQANAFLCKPFTSDQILLTLRKALTAEVVLPG